MHGQLASASKCTQFRGNKTTMAPWHWTPLHSICQISLSCDHASLAGLLGCICALSGEATACDCAGACQIQSHLTLLLHAHRHSLSKLFLSQLNIHEKKELLKHKRAFYIFLLLLFDSENVFDYVSRCKTKRAFAAPPAGATKLSAVCKATHSATPAAHRSRVERDRSLRSQRSCHI